MFPPLDSFGRINFFFSENILRILEEGLKYEKNKLFFIALGVTAKALAEEFF